MLFNADVTRACVMQPELSTSHGVAKNKVITTLAMLARILDAPSVKQMQLWHSDDTQLAPRIDITSEPRNNRKELIQTRKLDP